jgi:hypothetical protein
MDGELLGLMEIARLTWLLLSSESERERETSVLAVLRSLP